MITNQLVVDLERLAEHDARSSRGRYVSHGVARQRGGPSMFELARQRTTSGLRRLADAIDPGTGQVTATGSGD